MGVVRGLEIRSYFLGDYKSPRTIGITLFPLFLFQYS